VRLFHGTDVESAAALESGAELDLPTAKARHTNGAIGFYLATERGDAEFFAIRLGRGRVITYDFTTDALEGLIDSGCVLRPIPMGPASPNFEGSELFVPPELFPLFNELLSGGGISVVIT
jgi:hypothetical protein